MEFKWYKIFNLTEFEATGLTSRTYTQFLFGVGQRDILVTKGNKVSMLYEDQFLPVLFEDKNPYSKTDITSEKSYAVYKDENEDVWLGLGVEEDT